MTGVFRPNETYLIPVNMSVAGAVTVIGATRANQAGRTAIVLLAVEDVPTTTPSSMVGGWWNDHRSTIRSGVCNGRSTVRLKVQPLFASMRVTVISD